MKDGKKMISRSQRGWQNMQKNSVGLVLVSWQVLLFRLRWQIYASPLFVIGSPSQISCTPPLARTYFTPATILEPLRRFQQERVLSLSLILSVDLSFCLTHSNVRTPSVPFPAARAFFELVLRNIWLYSESGLG